MRNPKRGKCSTVKVSGISIDCANDTCRYAKDEMCRRRFLKFDTRSAFQADRPVVPLGGISIGRVSHRQDRAGGMADHFFGDAAQNRQGDLAAAVSPHHDEVHAVITREFDDA